MRYNISNEPADIIIHVQGKGIVLKEKERLKGTILLFLSMAAVLTGCGSNLHENSFEAVKNVEYSEADTRDEEVEPEDDMALSRESEVLNDSEKPDIENDTDLSAMEIYELFLNGELTVVQEKESVYISDLFWDNDIEYCFGDIDGDGNEELHIRDNNLYYTIKAEDGKLRIIFEGWRHYEPVVTDELCGILYYSNRYGFEEIDFIKMGADGSKESREYFYWYDENENGSMDENDYFEAKNFGDYNSEETDMEQYVQHREEQFARQAGNTLEWTCRRCKDFTSWQEAYIDFVNKPYSTTYRSEYGGDEYSLIYVDNNDVPELYIFTGGMAGGEIIVSFYDGKVRAMNRGRIGIAYMEYSGLLYSAAGSTGTYPFNVYMLEKGEFSEIGTGWGREHHYDEELQEIIYSYFWEDSPVTEAEFKAHIDELIDTLKCIEPPVLYTKDEIFEILCNREPAAVTESERREQTEIPDQYAELIAAATECVEGKVEEGPEDYYDFSYIIYRYGPHYGASMGLGYLIEDIDGNGTEELIFGQNDEPDSAWNGVIYDLYTISDGELVHVFSGGERDTCNLCENGLIANEGADGAAMSVFAYYSFEGKELHLVEAVIYNGWEDSENPWFYSTQSENMYETENMDSISEEQAWAIIEKYVFEHPQFTPFVEE